MPPQEMRVSAGAAHEQKDICVDDQISQLVDIACQLHQQTAEGDVDLRLRLGQCTKV